MRNGNEGRERKERGKTIGSTKHWRLELIFSGTARQFVQSKEQLALLVLPSLVNATLPLELVKLSKFIPDRAWAYIVLKMMVC